MQMKVLKACFLIVKASLKFSFIIYLTIVCWDFENTIQYIMNGIRYILSIS